MTQKKASHLRRPPLCWLPSVVTGKLTKQKMKENHVCTFIRNAEESPAWACYLRARLRCIFRSHVLSFQCSRCRDVPRAIIGHVVFRVFRENVGLCATGNIAFSKHMCENLSGVMAGGFGKVSECLCVVFSDFS